MREAEEARQAEQAQVAVATRVAQDALAEQQAERAQELARRIETVEGEVRATPQRFEVLERHVEAPWQNFPQSGAKSQTGWAPRAGLGQSTSLPRGILSTLSWTLPALCHGGASRTGRTCAWLRHRPPHRIHRPRASPRRRSTRGCRPRGRQTRFGSKSRRRKPWLWRRSRRSGRRNSYSVSRTWRGS